MQEDIKAIETHISIPLSTGKVTESQAPLWVSKSTCGPQFQPASSASSLAPGEISHSISYTQASCQTPQTCSCKQKKKQHVHSDTCLFRIIEIKAHY